MASEQTSGVCVCVGGFTLQLYTYMCMYVHHMERKRNSVTSLMGRTTMKHELIITSTQSSLITDFQESSCKALVKPPQ